jgi:hypothetical protein
MFALFADVPVVFFIVSKAGSACFVLTKVWNVTNNVVII